MRVPEGSPIELESGLDNVEVSDLGGVLVYDGTGSAIVGNTGELTLETRIVDLVRGAEGPRGK